MSLNKFFRSVCAIAVLAVTSQAALAAVFVPPPSGSITGTTPSGINWTTVASGSSLPVRSTTTAANGLPGAVVYWDTVTGQLQLDPKGWDLNALVISYNSGTGTIGAATPGPFTYSTGTGENALSGATGLANQKTFPAPSGASSLPPTTYPARIGITGLPLGTPFTSTGDAGNIASTGGGYWNVAWAFPSNLVSSGSISSIALSSFKTYNLQANANANILGWGSQQGVFQYGINGVVGNQMGAVIPVSAVPEPSTIALAGVGIAAAGGINYRRQMRRKKQALLEAAGEIIA
jgi:hypothetical protein